MNKLDLVKKGLEFIGVKGLAGESHNQTIIDFFKISKFSGIKNDETAWCSAFMITVATLAGFPTSGSLMARSWEKIGQNTIKPELGDIVVLWRESIESIYGHVGIFIAKNQTHVWILGGNQDNEVNIKKFPLERVLQYRDISK